MDPTRLEEEEEEQIDGQCSEEESSESESSESECNWIMWFITRRGNELYCQVDEAYIKDDFNMTGLPSVVTEYKRAMDTILDNYFPTDNITEARLQAIDDSAELLYGLIHARYILTTEGMNRMRAKYNHVHFGRCPRTFCEGQPVLPVGLSDIPFNYAVSVFCPKCLEVYHPRSTRQSTVDGAFFGTTFCHLFLLAHLELIPAKTPDTYVPRVFGYRINKDSEYYKKRGVPPNRSKPRSNGASPQSPQAVDTSSRETTVPANL